LCSTVDVILWADVRAQCAFLLSVLLIYITIVNFNCVLSK